MWTNSLQVPQPALHFGLAYPLKALLEAAMPSQIAVLVDENTQAHCLPLLLNVFRMLPEVPATIAPLILASPAGEEAKSMETYAHLLAAMLTAELDRDALLINLGGGVVSDLGGFLASTYKRGIRAVNIPTSLLGMVDAAVGGKNGLNLSGAKNVVGTFLPLPVLVHPTFLATLPPRELLSGKAEMLKHGLIADAAHAQALAELPPSTPPDRILIEASIAIKANIVATDPTEKAERALLNFGHTIGHALESHSHTLPSPLLHGEAIFQGMAVESLLAHHLGILGGDALSMILGYIGNIYALQPIQAQHFQALLGWMRNDKKTTNGALRFSLPIAVGAARFGIAATPSDVVAALNAYNTRYA